MKLTDKQCDKLQIIAAVVIVIYILSIVTLFLWG